MLELYVVYSSEEEQTAFVKFFLKAQGSATALCHCFNQDYARNNRVFREVSFKEKVFISKFSCGNTAIFIVAVNAVYEQKWFSVGQ